MDKVLLILPDNNKGKYITKGYGSAFEELNYFVIERKIYDLNVEEIQQIKPHLVFCFWSDIKQNGLLKAFFDELVLENTVFIHCSELESEIPEIFKNKNKNYCFSTDSKDKKCKIIQCINPKNYKTKFNGYNFSITFSGNPAYPNREELLSKLIFNYGPINIFCRSFDFYKSVDEIYKNKLLNDNYLELYRASYKGYVESQKEIAEIYCSSKINIDIENKNKKNLNYRCLEILASGGFLITPYNKYTVKQFDDGKDVETYKNFSELSDKIDFYLKNLNIAQSIAYRGKKNAVSNHSFYDRLKKMLKVIYGKDTCSR